MKETLGRPKVFNSVDELREKIEGFTEYCDSQGVPKTFERLSTFLKVDRKTLYNYKAKDEYAPLFEEIKQEILADIMQKGLTGEINPTFGIFCLKNYGYTDKQEVETVNTNLNKNVDLSNLTDEQIDRILAGE